MIFFFEVVLIDIFGKYFGLYGDKNFILIFMFVVYFDLKIKEVNLFSLLVMVILKG